MVYTGLYSDSINVDTLIVSYNNGCIVKAYDTIKIQYLAILAIPNAFSPNGDTKNDAFFILAKGVKDFTLHIYNRWGQEVFISNDINTGWDGNYKGKPQPGGVYQFFFTITYQNGKSENHSGPVTLLR